MANIRHIIIDSPKYGKKIVLVDDIDYGSCIKHKWGLSKSEKGRLYVTSSVWGKNKLYLHRFILNPSKGLVVDHINGETTDNRRINLRICPQRLNLRNQKLRSNSSTGKKGVYFYKSRVVYSSEITVNYKKIFLGYFDRLEDAALAYNKAAIDHFGEYAYLNKV